MVTARIPKEWRRYCFHRYLSVHISGGYPHGGPSFPTGVGGTPILPNGRRYPIQGQDGGYPIQDQDRGGGTPLSRSGPRSGRGVGGTPNWNSTYLLRIGRYASCIHAGGLSCFKIKLRRPP